MVFSILPLGLDLSRLAAASQLQASGDGKLQAETKLSQAQNELAEKKAVEQRLRDRLARQEAKSLDRKEVGAASVLLCVSGPALCALLPMPMQAAAASSVECVLVVVITQARLHVGMFQPPECLHRRGHRTVCA